MGKKFVGLDGLKHFWTKAKTWIAGQITAEVTAKIAEIVANAPEDLDTLKEIADWISEHADDAAAMNTQITENKNNIAANSSSISALNTQIQTNKDNIATNTSDISALKTSVAGKADKSHTHTKSQITDFPTSLPANGGTAAKVSSAGLSTMWIYGRNEAICKITAAAEGGGWKTLASIKTLSGSIEIGNLSGEDFVRIVYSSDADLNTGNNTVANIVQIRNSGITSDFNITAPNITSLEQRVAALESKI